MLYLALFEYGLETKFDLNAFIVVNYMYDSELKSKGKWNAFKNGLVYLGGTHVTGV